MAGIGVDGCREGWLGIRIEGETSWSADIFSTVETLKDSWCSPDDLILIDVPIGLPDTSSCRPCDAAARKYLGARASSVFNPPTRAALDAETYMEAADRNEEACGKRLSKQTWAIMPKIAEVDRFFRDEPDRQGFVREIHPELLFQSLNANEPLTSRKKEARGQAERLALLVAYLPSARDIYDSLVSRYRRNQAALDDILDALVAAVVAHRYPDSLTTLPVTPDRDHAGLICEMVLPAIKDFPRGIPLADDEVVPVLVGDEVFHVSKERIPEVRRLLLDLGGNPP